MDPPSVDIPTYVEIIILVSCILSFLGSFLIITTYITWPELRTKPRQLLVFLSVTDMLSAISYFYGVFMSFDSNSWDCVTQGAVSTFANTSSFFWTVAVAIYLYVVIVKANKKVADGLVVWFHLICWCVPLLITVTAVALKKIGYDASAVSVGWCWIRIDAGDHMLWMLLTGKIWEFIAYISLPVLYILIKVHIHTAHSALAEYRPLLVRTSSYQSSSSIADKKLTFIPIIFIILRIWSTVRFILAICNSTTVWNPTLVALHVSSTV
ncbi:G-protein coupled receptor 157 [Protopterus annectens]|uniref:G-protein coupled receptor 157 n=1 Tax=Protopterus annectens TaxID=7888 RepID=UPI001CFA2811|nr:G-protein coupled receptor 157 [Protopterus annectens]